MVKLLRFLFFGLFVRPVINLLLGINVRGRELLPKNGPAIIIANHNSHLDTMVLMSLLPLRMLPIVHPIAAADYFLRNRFLAWFSLNIIGIVPLNRERQSPGEDLLAPCSEALEKGWVLIFFPEGSRGDPERMSTFKSGIARLVERHPDVPVTPVFLHGLGKALPKDESLLVPLVLDAFVGQSLSWCGDRKVFMEQVKGSIGSLAASAKLPEWD